MAGREFHMERQAGTGAPHVGRDSPVGQDSCQCGQGGAALGAGVQVWGDPGAVRGELQTGLLMAATSMEHS